jgi:hypothetical protein
MRGIRFEAELVLGHKGVVVVLAPFDPEEAFGTKPVRLAGRRHGWLVKGAVNGEKLEGYIGERWGRFFVIIGEPLRRAAGVAVGDEVTVTVAPTTSRSVLAKAVEQSEQTTQPGKARRDAVTSPRS